MKTLLDYLKDIPANLPAPRRMELAQKAMDADKAKASGG